MVSAIIKELKPLDEASETGFAFLPPGSGFPLFSRQPIRVGCGWTSAFLFKTTKAGGNLRRMKQCQ